MAPAQPVHPAGARWFTSRGRDPIAAAIAGGDDYELLFSVPARARGRWRNVVRHAHGIPLTKIGELTRDRQILLSREGSMEPLPQGFVHF